MRPVPGRGPTARAGLVRELQRQLGDLEISVVSPDRTVTVTVTGAGRIQVGLAEDCLAQHTEQSLAREVTRAARDAVAAAIQVIDDGYQRVARTYRPRS